MTARRLSTAADGPAVPFTFDGKPFEGRPGDTVASALLAAGVRVVGRSFKYHRPRGVWGAGVEEPNALVDVSLDGRTAPNLRATTEPLVEGMALRAVNARPNAAADRGRVLDRFAKFIPAGFYYKTFIWPDWHRFEPRIRAMAGLGRLEPATQPPADCPIVHARCDVLVVGAGPAGLSAARAAAASGGSVILVDDQERPGGALLHRHAEIDGRPGRIWAASCVEALRAAGHRVLASATAFGVYDHNLVGVWQRRFGRPDALWQIRAGRIVVAAGAIERPLVFPDNDRPGVMSAEAALFYLRRHDLLVGERIVVATNNDKAYAVARALATAGARVAIADLRASAAPQTAEGLSVLPGARVTAVEGEDGVEAVRVGGRRVEADCLLVSGGFTPTVHLHAQAKGKLRYEESLAAFVPGERLPGLVVAGAANGRFSLSGVLADGHAAGGGRGVAARSVTADDSYAIEPAWPGRAGKARQWIDFQNDVTVKDVELAARENFRSVEHLKRYTTLGMATDQGKTSNLNGLALMAEITGRSVPEVGTTTYRPPFTPVPLASFAGAADGELMAPVRRLPLENIHRADGAVFQEYGGWLRPAHYGGADADRDIREEARRARHSVALFDGSTLGKIEVMGPKAAEFIDFIYYNTMSTLKPGRCRYGFMLSENGVVFDDGILVRLDEHRFVVSCSTSHVASVHARLEEWRQDRFGRDAVYIHNATSEMATLTVSGPQSKRLVAALDLGLSLEDADLPHMAIGTGAFAGEPVRVARVSFTGDRSYEVSIRADRAEALWQRMKEAGEALDAVAIGLEALMILRAEKGYIVIGKDTDGTTMPHDLGVEGPRAKRKTEFVGRRSLFTEVAESPDRMQLVGLSVAEGEPPLPTGAHGVERKDGRTRSLGYVTSSYYSPALDAPIALGLIERGASRHGETIDIQHLGLMRRATITAPCSFDPAGERLNA